MTASSRFIIYIFFLGLLQTNILFLYGDCWYDNKKYEENTEVPTGEPCLNCTCNRNALLCYLRVCPKLPNPPPKGCILLHRYKNCCPELICTEFYDGGNSLEARADPQGDVDVLSDDQSFLYQNACISNGSIYGPGSAMHSSSLCEYCYCLGGKQTCVKPKCLLPIPGCIPVLEENNCCPVRYNCTKDLFSSTSTVKNLILDNTDESAGCFVDGNYHSEGTKIIGVGHSVCDNCYCLKGILRCEPLSCAPALLGCTPIIKSGECCAASYNCNGVIDAKPNYGLFPTITNGYSKSRNEINKKNSTAAGVEKIAAIAPFYQLPSSEIAHPHHHAAPTTKFILQRSPETFGTTRQFFGANQPSSTEKSLDKNFLLISSSKNQYDSSTESSNKETRIETKETDGRDNFNIISFVNSIMDDKSYRNINDNNNSSITTTETDIFTETTSFLEQYSTLISTTTDVIVTVTTILNSTDCSSSNLEKAIDESTQTYPEEINNLAESRTEYLSTTDLQTQETSSQEEYFPTLESDVKLLKNKEIPNAASKLSPDISALLLATNNNRNRGENFDYDYNEPTLPPSLPNLKIIPFVAADAVDKNNDLPLNNNNNKDILLISSKSDDDYPSIFKPPVETEGGFVPKDSLLGDPFYNNNGGSKSEPTESVDVSHCISKGQIIQHGISVSSESPCVTCTCFYGNIACQRIVCSVPIRGCKLSTDQKITLCCPTYVCDDQVLSAQNPPEIITVAEGIIPLEPFNDVIRTESAPNLNKLIGDIFSYKKHSNSDPISETNDENLGGFEKVLTFISSGTPDVIEKPPSQNPAIVQILKNDTVIKNSTLNFAQNKKENIANIKKINVTTNNDDIEKNQLELLSKNKTVEAPLGGVGLLKLAGCNIYGRMYRVGRIISELSGPCVECKCTEIGVQCRDLKCSDNNNN